jgi:dinuclear metal center YbgI/SA1388 family protein
MITRSVLLDLLNTKLQPELFKDYCPNGLQVEGKASIHKIATAVTASLQTIEQAIDEQVDALIVHHGLFWHGQLQTVCGAHKKRLQALLEHEISLFAYHLPLDAHPQIGNNWAAAIDLNWKELEPFQEIGVKAVLEPIALEDLIHQLQAYYGQAARVAACDRPFIHNVALISGGAYKSLPVAAAEGIDCFITGNADEPVWHTAKEEGIHFISMGHSATEKVGPRHLARWLKNEIRVDTLFIEDHNPF